MVDLRRERQLINKHQRLYGREMGTSVQWAAYDPTNSTEDPLFSDGGGLEGRRFLPLVTVPVLWIDNIEGPVNADAFRTDKSDDVRMGVSYDQFRGAGVHAASDDDRHLLDIFFWPVKGQWYKVNDWEVLGQYAADYIVIGITGVQVWPDEEYLTEAFPPIGAPPVS